MPLAALKRQAERDLLTIFHAILFACFVAFSIDSREKTLEGQELWHLAPI